MGIDNLTRREFCGLAASAVIAPSLAQSANRNSEISESLEREYQRCLTKVDEKRMVDINYFSQLKHHMHPKIQLALANISAVDPTYKDKDEEIIRSFDRIIDANPDYIATILNRGTSYLFKAEQPSKEELMANPRIASIISDEMMRCGEAAIEDFDKVIELEPRSFAGYYNKGIALHRIGRETDAIKSLTKAIDIGWKLKPFRKSTLSNEDELYTIWSGDLMVVKSTSRRHIQDKYMTKRYALEKAIYHAPGILFLSNENDLMAFAHCHKGTCYGSSRLKDYRNAVLALSEAIRLNPNVPYFYQVRYISYMGLKAITKDSSYSEKALVDKVKVQKLAKKVQNIWKNGR